MEKGRADRCGRVFATGSRNPTSWSVDQGGFVPIVITATLSVVALLAIVGWEVQKVLQEKQEASLFIAVSSEKDPIELGNALGGTSAGAEDGAVTAAPTNLVSYIGPAVLDQLLGAYVQMRQDGTYTSSEGQKVAENLATVVKAPVEYRAYETRDLKTDPDTSYKRMLTYRDDLREALAPLLENMQPEYEIFALYASTKDPKYLAELHGAAQNYHDAQTAAVEIVVPRDATAYHIAIVNAMGEFAATLDAMSEHGDDPFAAVALLRTYNEGEMDILTSFNSLTTYYKSKIP